MLVELFTVKDVEVIKESSVREYLKKRFKEIGNIKDPATEGYFVYVENFKDLHKRNLLRYVTLSSVEEGLFRPFEGFTLKDDIVEVALLFNNEFLISLVFHNLDEESLSYLFHYKSHAVQNSKITQSTLNTYPVPHQISPLPPRDTCNSAEITSMVASVGFILLRCMLKR